MLEPTVQTKRKTGYYGAFAFGSITLTAFASFLTERVYYTPAYYVPLVFVLGAVYVGAGVITSSQDDHQTSLSWRYFAFQAAVLTAIVILSPVRGFMGLIVLPAVSQGIFHLRPSYAAVLGVYLFGLATGVWYVPHGWDAVLRAGTNYSTAFIFTVAFTLITKQALTAREREAKLRREVEAANELLRLQAAQAEELATTRERNRVAREIHDGVGHYLTVIKTQLDAAEAFLPTQPVRAGEIVASAAKLASEALEDVRRSVGALRADAERPPLSEALHALTQQAGLPVTLRIEGGMRRLPSAVEHALFRSAQEGLTNVRKHAAATSAELALDFRPASNVILEVMDNGAGGAGVNSGGFGLRGIRERVELLGGRVQAGRRPQGGFALKVEVPA